MRNSGLSQVSSHLMAKSIRGQSGLGQFLRVATESENSISFVTELLLKGVSLFDLTIVTPTFDRLSVVRHASILLFTEIVA